MPRSIVALLAVLCLSFGAVACGGDDDDGGSSAGGGHEATTLKAGDVIGMDNLKFAPDHVEVPVGQEITWRNEESVPHDVVADEGADFKSDTFGKGETFAYTPTAAGTITYECTLHPGMDGTIDVVAP